MDAWLSAARDVVAETAGLSRDAVDLDREASVRLLELARIAAHESGDRRNAPLLCYLVGLAVAGGDADVARLADALKAAPP